jgi:hypothetical protein
VGQDWEFSMTRENDDLRKSALKNTVYMGDFQDQKKQTTGKQCIQEQWIEFSLYK